MNKMHALLFGSLLIALASYGCAPQTTPESQKSPSNDTVQHQAEPQDMAKDTQNTQENADTPDSISRDALGYQLDTFNTPSGKLVAFHAIKHGSLRIQYDGLEFEIDPVITLNDKTTGYDASPDADYLLVTHEHYDHLDPDAIKALEKPETVLITNKSCAEQLKKGEIMSNGDSRALRDDIRLEAVPAYNTTPGHEQFHPKGRDNGFILTLDGFKIYIAGDTEDIPEMADIHDIDVAFLPCNQPYTMTPAQLAHAAQMINPKVLFPYHYGATSMDEVKAALKDTNIDVRIRDYQ